MPLDLIVTKNGNIYRILYESMLHQRLPACSPKTISVPLMFYRGSIVLRFLLNIILFGLYVKLVSVVFSVSIIFILFSIEYLDQRKMK